MAAGRFSSCEAGLGIGQGSHTRKALVGWLKRNYDGKRRTPKAADLDAMREAMVERYFEVVCGSMRRHDPNHLLLGVRFYGKPPAFMTKPMHFMDVVSINNYETRPNVALMSALHKATGKPLLLGEFHAGSTDRGLAW